MSKYMLKNYSVNVSERNKYKYFLIIFTYVALIGCGHYIAPYNETAYQNATDLKVDSLAAIAKATEPYLDHAKEVDSLMINIDQAYEFAKGLPKNDIVTKQWEIMLDPDGNMLGGFIKKWKNDGQLNKVFVEEMNGQVSQGFDQIIELESAKIKE